MEQSRPLTYLSYSSSSAVPVAQTETADSESTSCPRRMSGASKVDQLVFDGFLRLRRCSRGAVVALSDRIMITNSIAGELLLPSDRLRLWALAQTVLSEGGKPAREIALSSGVSVFARCQAILAQGVLVGALLQLSHPLKARVRSSSSNSLDSAVARWRSLTDAERAVAEVVALGLTNREAGRRVYLSTHTVDAHLRQIFRKLGINSRVELARIVGEHHHQLKSIEGRTTVLESYRFREDACAWSA